MSKFLFFYKNPIFYRRLAKTVLVIVFIVTFLLFLNALGNQESGFSMAVRQYVKVGFLPEAGFWVEEIGEPELLSGYFSKIVASGSQIGNFIKSSFGKPNALVGYDDFESIYRASSERKFFADREVYMTTGAPHSRAFYLRNHGMFYHGLVNPEISLNEEDYTNRVSILVKDLGFILGLFEGKEFTTTVVPIFRNFYVAIDYTNPPSDSSLGVLTMLDYLVQPETYGYTDTYKEVQYYGKKKGLEILSLYREDLRSKIYHDFENLERVSVAGHSLPILDKNHSCSTAADTRMELQRFVVSANFYTVLKKATSLGIISENEVRENVGYTLAEYKEAILNTFGQNGYIQNSLHYDYFDKSDPAGNIVLDFAHVPNGFWDFSKGRDREIFRNTADLVLQDDRFFDNNHEGILLSIKNPDVRFFYDFFAADYQGRTVWPYYNVQFARSLIQLSEKENARFYREEAKKILDFCKRKTVELGGYPEVLDLNGRLYQKLFYQSAIADSWLVGLKELDVLVNNAS